MDADRAGAARRQKQRDLVVATTRAHRHVVGGRGRIDADRVCATGSVDVQRLDEQEGGRHATDGDLAACQRHAVAAIGAADINVVAAGAAVDAAGNRLDGAEREGVVGAAADQVFEGGETATGDVAGVHAGDEPRRVGIRAGQGVGQVGADQAVDPGTHAVGDASGRVGT